MAPHSLDEIILRVIEGLSALPQESDRRVALMAALWPFGVDMAPETAARALALQTILNRYTGSAPEYDLDSRDLAAASLAASGLLRIAKSEADAAEGRNVFNLT